MKTSTDFPPNYALINELLGDVSSHNPVFCYGDTIYNPFDVKITPDLEKHEEVHSIQQGDTPDLWWNMYLTNSEFRLEQEIAAYGTQMAFLKTLNMPSKLYEWFKDKTAQALSGELYGNLLTYGEAVSKIRNYAKTIA